MKFSFLSLVLALGLTANAHAACQCGENCKCGGGDACECSAKKEETGHPLRGSVTRVLEERKLVLIKHEEIPGFMKAMTMGFSVPEEVLPQLKPGMHLTATLHGSRGDWQLTDVVLTDENYQPLSETKKKVSSPSS